MMRFARRPEPQAFDERVRQPGQRWLQANPATRRDFPPHWRRVAPELRRAFNDLTRRCGSPPGSVDHFVSLDEDRQLADEWSNLRYAAQWINSSKSGLRANELLDPFDVEDDWFEVLLPSCQLVVTERCPPALRARARTMLTRLRLGHDEAVVEYRRAWYQMYIEGEVLIAGLERRAPLIARAIRKQC